MAFPPSSRKRQKLHILRLAANLPPRLFCNQSNSLYFTAMEPFGHFDIIAYVILLYLYVLKDYGLAWFFDLATHVPWKPIYNYVCFRVWLPFPYQHMFTQRSTNVEFMFVELIKYYFRSVQYKTYGSVFFDGRIFKWVNRFRTWRYCRDGLGDIVVQDVDKGLKIFSASRNTGRKHDIAIFYVHGGVFGFGQGSGYLYSEYLSLLCINLLHQGFTNPLIFVANYPQRNQAVHLQKCYRHFSTIVEHDNWVLMADSTGATMALMLMKQLVAKDIPMPYLSIYISPVIISCTSDNWVPRRNESTSDYVNYDVVATWHKQYGAEYVITDNDWQCLSNDIVITYSSQEYLAPQIEDLITKLQSRTRVRVDCYNGRVHNWPILGFYTERAVDKREYSIQFYGAFIARVMMTDCIFESGNPINFNYRDETYI